jgi:hypothetical protein
MRLISKQPATILFAGIACCVLLMGVIVYFGPYSEGFVLGEDQGDMWYYWKLADPTFWTRATAWGAYSLHQLSIWSLIYFAQQQRPNYSKGLHPVNVLALTANVVFVGLHIVQTKYFYDGLAQDTHLVSSLGSVALMLVFILVMENQRRGMFFGKRGPFLKEVGQFLRKYHGYYFSWAVIYTFWYHPIEITLGHLLGTFYILMLLLQGSLFFTRSHSNRKWTLLLETFVIIHAFMVAYVTHADSQGLETAGRFIFGFGAIFIVTQMHGLRLSGWLRWLLAAAYMLAVIAFYHGQWGLAVDVLRIPVVDYVLVFVSAALVWLFFLLPAKLLRGNRQG